MTQREFYERFATNESCLEYLRDIVDVHCPKCGYNDYYGLSTKQYRCKKCAATFTEKSLSVFKNSKLTLPQIFENIWTFASLKKSISSVQVHKNTGVNQCRTWANMHKIRRAITPLGSHMFTGTVEVDEVYLSGGLKWQRWGRQSSRKTPILGLLERDSGIVKIIPINNKRSSTLHNVILEFVEKGSTVYSDSWNGYIGLDKWYEHDTVNHSANQYVNGDIHINGIEGVWRHLKTNLRHAHHYISGEYIHEYCNEIEFRHNTRDWHVLDRFNKLIHDCFQYRY